MRRLVSLALTAAMLAVLFAVPPIARSEAAVGAYEVVAAVGATLYGNAQTSLDIASRAPKGAVLNVLRIENGFGYTVYDAVYGWVQLNDALQFRSASPGITGGRVEGAAALRITSMPDKTTYYDGDEPDTEGLAVAVVFDDAAGTTLPVYDYSVSFPSMYAPGDARVQIYYAGLKTSYPITILRLPVTGLRLIPPDKTTYVQGEKISLEGLSVYAVFSDGRADEPLGSGDYTLTGIEDGATPAVGTYTVTVGYLYPDVSAQFHIYVSPKTVLSLRLIDMPASTVLYEGQVFDPSDFKLEATYDNGEIETVTDVDILYDGMEVGAHTARIYYMGRYVMFDYTVAALRQTGIRVDTGYGAGSYVDAPLNFSALRVFTVYNSAAEVPTADYTLEHAIDPSVPGEYVVTVKSGGFSATFPYIVAARKDVLIGDVDLNGSLQAADARLALRISADLWQPEEFASYIAADVNDDGHVRAGDARKILRVSAKLDTF